MPATFIDRYFKTQTDWNPALHPRDEIGRFAVKALVGVIEKYSPDQPREPAGQPGGGRWTSGGRWTQGLTAEDWADDQRYWDSVRDMEAAVEGDEVDFGHVDTRDNYVAWDYMSRYGEEEFGDWAASLTDEERQTIKDYAEEGYTPVNSLLRKGVVSGSVIEGEDWTVTYDPEEMISVLDEALSRSKLPKDMVLYRGKGMRPGQFNLAEGDEFIDRGFVSTSLDPALGNLYGKWAKLPYTFRIHVPKGTIGAYIGRYPTAKHELGKESEYEILLARGLHFRVGKISTDVPGRVVVDLEVIP